MSLTNNTQSILGGADSAEPLPLNESPTSTHTLPQVVPKTANPQSTAKPHPSKEDTLDPDTFPDTIPPAHASRTLVLCFDGTRDQFDSDNSNIINLFAMLKKDDRTQQMVYYQSGIGTYISPKVASRLATRFAKILDTAVAWSLNAHVMDGYEFLMQNYRAGDRICIFGFSRGAYTARSLAGMIQKVGLLPSDNWQQVPFAYKMYTETDALGWDQSTQFKRTFSIDVKIEFLGVWDTVDSVGIIPRHLPFTTSNTIVRTFRHALALDERRAKFKANMWNRPTEAQQRLGTLMPTRFRTRNTTQYSTKLRLDLRENRDKTPFPKWDPEDERFLREMERIHAERHHHPTDVEEVWFAGCHCDVGGGSVPNNTRYSLARISLRWMIRECFKTNTGIMFDSNRLQEIGLDPETLYPFVTPRPSRLSAEGLHIQSTKQSRASVDNLYKPGQSPHIGQSLDQGEPELFIGEEDEELADALSPQYDRLKLSKFWWLVELIPMVFRHQEGNDKWVSWFGPNLARPRHIPKRHTSIKIHRSVKTRMEALMPKDESSTRYTPRAALSDDVAWVD